MRIQFTDNNNNTYTIETIKSFAKYLASKISDGTVKPGKTKFIADFALTSYDEDCEITIPEVLSNVERDGGFYGVKELGEIGFNSTNRQFAFDYYGGQHLRIFDFDEGFMGKDDAEWKIDEILTDIFDVSKDNYLLLIQWNEDECLAEDEKKAEAESTKKIEDEAVKNFAEMLKGRIEGAVGAGYDGIGKEDLDDALYEYLKWDKKYAKEYEETKPNNGGSIVKE